MSDNNKEMIKGKDKTRKETSEGVIKAESIESTNKPTITPSPVSSTILTKSKKKTTEVTVALTESELKTLDYTDFSTPARMLELGKVLAKSKLVPLTSADDVVVALMAGKELGLPFVTSVSQIYPINGRATLGVHIQKALCLKNGVTFEKIEDAINIYSFVKKDKDGNVILKDVQTKEGIKKVPIIVSEGTLEEQPDNTGRKEIDRRTTYKFTREIKMLSGKYKEVTAMGSFSLREAREAELTEKDVWIKYWRRMLDARAFTNGAREIADDILLGLMTPNELSNDFYVNEQGEEIHKVEVI